MIITTAVARRGVKKATKLSLAIVLPMALYACATTNSGPGQYEPTEQDLAKYERKTTQGALQEAEKLLAESEKKDLSFYAPRHYEIAGQALQEARDYIQSNSPRDKVVTKVAVADAVMRNADRVVRQVKEILKPELEIKEALDESDSTDSVYAREYASLLERLDKVIRNIEDGKVDDANKMRPELAKELQDLEVRAVLRDALHETEEVLKRVKYSGGEQLAPLTFAEAQEVFKRSKEFIRAHAGDREKVKAVAEEARFAAKRALYITSEVAALSHKVKLSLEQVVLDEEYRLFRVARFMGADDVRNNPLEVQSELLAKSAENLLEEKNHQIDLANILREAIIDQASKEADVDSLKQRVAEFKQEKNQWLAKDALYSAKLKQLTTDLQQESQRAQKAEQELASLKLVEQQRQLDKAKAEFAKQQAAAAAAEQASIQKPAAKESIAVSEPTKEAPSAVRAKPAIAATETKAVEQKVKQEPTAAETKVIETKPAEIKPEVAASETEVVEVAEQALEQKPQAKIVATPKDPAPEFVNQAVAVVKPAKLEKEVAAVPVEEPVETVAKEDANEPLAVEAVEETVAEKTPEPSGAIGMVAEQLKPKSDTSKSKVTPAEEKPVRFNFDEAFADL